jgi:Transposase DDE domain group 1
MPEQVNPASFDFGSLGSREVVAQFNGGNISTEGGALILREVERQARIVQQFTACFIDHRRQDRIEHPLQQLIAQRVFGLALGYEDLNDHDDLCRDPLFAAAVGQKDLLGERRENRRDKGKALAGKSTLNRLELTLPDAGPQTRYKKISWKPQEVDALFVNLFLQAQDRPPEEIVIDVDATDDPLHGQQEGRFFHGYYGNYCYLPLYIFCGESLLCARLRKADIDPAKGTVEELDRIVKQIRQTWPDVRIVIRGDSGFAREELMHWCEANTVDFVFGLAQNARLNREIEAELLQAKSQHEQSGQAVRIFKELLYSTLDTWSRKRRVVAKAEHLEKGSNPRFVVTSISAETLDAKTLYEVLYCARGDMENRIKEQQLMMFADRTSTATMRANQLRLWFSSVAYSLLQALRRLGLRGTAMAQAQCQTIRLKLLKIGALIRVTTRKVWISLAGGWPHHALFAQVYQNLRATAAQGAPEGAAI